MDLQSSSYRFALGLLRPEEMISVGVRAIESGSESPSLWLLAGLSRAESDDAPRLFELALSECSISMPSKSTSVIAIAKEVAADVLQEKVTVADAIRRIAGLYYRFITPEEEFSALDDFLYVESEWDERPEDHKLFEEGIKRACVNLLRP